MRQISPPIGINLYVVQAMWTGKLKDVVMGTIPFHLLMVMLLVALVAWPQLACGRRREYARILQT